MYLNSNQLVNHEANIFANQKNLIVLHLDNNKLSSKAKSNLPLNSLRILNLGLNRLEIIEERSFEYHTNLVLIKSAK